ncbi:uncharacterized protein CANTADRAFT_278257 [Suhomyces tanzawaensis NRRL Y-17324]|uniref:Uncharacterized protein n=1 Tax=Suhomyces tanzawaensis NRRL Y-17324 TaxID=984487 RepID=A0A1E4SH67_9ASCO|nr:uncharacterized protein CANTADRAFT_278257 [Suhomyces tanzawaensis NRRL Y-17324]ODV78836.1 hypothetical protein CANTADRAFT_278257 [Suhomyces tanzawaensis NRRL Y-17324]
MLILLDAADLDEETSQLGANWIGVKATWIKGNKVPSSLQEVLGGEIFEVRDIEDKGEYLLIPAGVGGVVVQSEKGLVSIAAWRRQKNAGEIEHDGPWQIYSEQEANTVAYYYLGDTQTVFMGLMETPDASPLFTAA